MLPVARDMAATHGNCQSELPLTVCIEKKLRKAQEREDVRGIPLTLPVIFVAHHLDVTPCREAALSPAALRDHAADGAQRQMMGVWGPWPQVYPFLILSLFSQT
jgi:hypothetical protein